MFYVALSHLDDFRLQLATGRPTNIFPLTFKFRDACSAHWVYMLKPMWILLFLTTNYLHLSGHYMYLQFTIKQFYVLPTQCIYVFCVDLRTNSDYFTVQH